MFRPRHSLSRRLPDMPPRCPHLSARTDGKWLTYVCRSPGPCPDQACQANPCFQEPDPDDTHE
ncbi:MAG: hypothetical protein QHH04_09205 [Methanolinea sp.]|nr:hypothetical protein [Methanolinea sp.]